MSSRASDPVISERHIEQLLETIRKLCDSGEDERAIEILNQEDLIWNGTRITALAARGCFMRMGEVSSALGIVNHILRTFGDDDALRRDARFLLGRLIETDTGWSPSLTSIRENRPRVDRRVLHLLKESLPYRETGYTMRSAMTLESQRRAGFEPIVVTSLGFPRRTGVTEFPGREIVNGVPHHRVDLGPDYPEQAPYDILLNDQLRLTSEIVSEVAPSLIQAGSSYRGYDGILVGLALARSLNLPSIYEVRGFLEQTWTRNVARNETGEYYWRRRAQEDRCMAEVTAVVTIAEAMRDEIVARGIDEEKVHVVPNAVDTQRFTPRPKRADLVATYGLEGTLVLGYVSNLGWREGVKHLVAAMRILVDRGHEVSCLLVGEGPERDRLTTLVRDLDLESRIVLTGHIPNESIEDHYALIDIFVVPRVNDRASRLVTPLKPLEAMSMGMPVVASDLPALRELVTHGERGMLFTSESSEDLAMVLDQLIDDEELRKGLAEAGASWVRTQRTLDSNAIRYQAILATVI